MADRFPVSGGTCTRILQHNGEPLAWVRSLGFDSVWVAEPRGVRFFRRRHRCSDKKSTGAPPSRRRTNSPRCLERSRGLDRGSDPGSWTVRNESTMRGNDLAAPTSTCSWQRPPRRLSVESYLRVARCCDGVVLDAANGYETLSSGEDEGDVPPSSDQRQTMGQRVRGIGNGLALSKADEDRLTDRALSAGTFLLAGMWGGKSPMPWRRNRRPF